MSRELPSLYMPVAKSWRLSATKIIEFEGVIWIFSSVTPGFGFWVLDAG